MNENGRWFIYLCNVTILRDQWTDSNAFFENDTNRLEKEL